MWDITFMQIWDITESPSLNLLKFFTSAPTFSSKTIWVLPVNGKQRKNLYYREFRRLINNFIYGKLTVFNLVITTWSYISHYSSINLFLILPFAFFLTEADGFSFGPRNGLKARFYEACVILSLLFILVLFFFCLLVRRIVIY